MEYAYFPGCSLESTAKEYDLSVRAVCQAMGIKLEELPDWNCCGASSGHTTNYRFPHALPGRNLALAEREGLDIAVACPACFLRLKNTKHESIDAGLREELVKLVGLPYEARHDIKHLLDIIGVDTVQGMVRKPLNGLKVASYYGCFLVRPPKVAEFDDPENPQSLDNLMNALGADALDWNGKVGCCGGSLSLTRKDIVVRLIGEIVEEARQVGAEAIVTACPLCLSNLESRQGSRANNLPVFYFTELMGLAMEIPQGTAWFKKHLISPLGVLASRGLIRR